MSQENKDKADVAEDRTRQTKGFVRQVRAASRRKYTPEEKIRIVPEGLRGEESIAAPCRREATSGEVMSLRKENVQFKECGVDLTGECHHHSGRYQSGICVEIEAVSCGHERLTIAEGCSPIYSIQPTAELSTGRHANSVT